MDYHRKEDNPFGLFCIFVKCILDKTRKEYYCISQVVQ